MRDNLSIKVGGQDFGWDLKGFLEPLIEVWDAGEEVVVTVDLPSVEKKDIELHATGDTLELQARMGREYCFERWGTIQKGVSFTSFRKVITLQTPIDVENIKTRFHKGILEIHLPKKSGRRSIDII